MLKTEDDQLFYDFAQALEECAKRFAALVRGTRRDAWIGIDEACEITGLTARQIRYQAEIGNIDSRPKPDNRRGMLYSRYDCMAVFEKGNTAKSQIENQQKGGNESQPSYLNS